MKLLEIQASVRFSGSVSRSLSAMFVDTWLSCHPDAQHIVRDIGIDPPAHPTELWTKANYTLPPEKRTQEMIDTLALSDELIDELLAADRIVLAVPMYNHSVPSNFKAYIDNVVRVGRTFTFDKETLTFGGLATGKKSLLINPSAGNYNPGMPMATMDFCEPYVRAVFHFIGIEQMECVKVPDQFMPDNVRQQAIETARYQLMKLAKTW